MAIYYVDSGDTQRSGHSMKGVWVANTAYSLGDLVVPTRAYATAAAKKYVYQCTTAGTSHATTEPTWGYATPGTTTTSDGTAVWTCEEANTADHATCFMDYLAIPGALRAAAGDTVYVFNTHSQSTADTVDIARVTDGNPIKFICTSSFSTPAGSTGATITVTGNAAIAFSGYFYGISFVQSGSGANQRISTTGATGHSTFLINCALVLGSAAGTYVHSTGRTVLVDTVVKFGNTGQAFIGFFDVVGPGVTYTVDNTGSIPTTLIKPYGNAASFRRADLSNLTNTTLVGATSSSATVWFYGCDIPAVGSYTLLGTGPSALQEAYLVNCASGDSQVSYGHSSVAADEIADTTIYRSTGASDGTNSWSRKVASLAAARFATPHVIELVAFNTAVGSAINATVYWMLDNAGTALKCGECWLEVEHMGTAGSTLSTVTVQSSPAGPGDIITPNTTDATTDSGSTWTGATNPTKQKAVVSITPQEIGLVRARLFIAKPSVTLYVDPVLYLG